MMPDAVVCSAATGSIRTRSAKGLMLTDILKFSFYNVCCLAYYEFRATRILMQFFPVLIGLRDKNSL
jgi:hypothetical protein